MNVAIIKWKMTEAGESHADFYCNHILKKKHNYNTRFEKNSNLNSFRQNAMHRIEVRNVFISNFESNFDDICTTHIQF